MRLIIFILLSIVFSVYSNAQLPVKSKVYSIKKSGAVRMDTLKDKNDFHEPLKEMPKQGPDRSIQPKRTNFTFQKSATVNFSDIQQDFDPKLLLKEMPRHRNEKMEIYHYPEKQNQSAKTLAVPLQSLSLGQTYAANGWGLSTPNDNDLAISNDGMLISVVNTNIYVRNTVKDSVYNSKSLAAFTTPINSKHQEFDPKVMYDPKTDRFVLVCLVGFVDTTSKIIIGFSQTNDPGGNWNLYKLPGNPLNNNLWTDYPMISMTEKELFLTVNLLVNNQPWQTGFVETIVWQMKKDSGYAGLPLGSVLHSNINFNGKPIRNLCPVRGGSQLYQPNMYFLSNRNLASQNDSVFLINITDTIGAPSGTLTTKVMVSNQPYYFPNDARQTNTTQTLATNDCRNLGAFLENNQIQFVHNTNNPANNQPSVYYGIITGLQNPTPTVNGSILANDTVDFAYPNISYAGNGPADNTAIINFNHSSNKLNTGCSAIRADGQGNYSPILRIKNGTTFVNLLQGGLERWGDYTGTQRKYANPGEVWVSGYYASAASGQYPNAHATWIAQLALNPIYITSLNGVKNGNEKSANVFPNPAKDIFSVELNLSNPEYLSFELYDVQGKLIDVLLRDWVKVKQNTFSFRTTDLKSGIYFLRITGNNGTSLNKKVVVE